MKPMELLGLALLALSTMAASVALAGQPEILPVPTEKNRLRSRIKPKQAPCHYSKVRVEKSWLRNSHCNGRIHDAGSRQGINDIYGL
jgi:hypothetical protein